ncbi:CstA-like transporter-associated (seleno)protein [Neisseria animalis]|uniref:Putative selenoprotein n=1 Tax=Neisseria animalis TaxID=492 RepID=A0A5P3MRL4_NEIAN|nr:CstA-like transporter-associated (seleno)protein [Neisseria animalis]QEY24224.1 putative selenoprotein [Neisseria animalis]ROW32167.1 putative selenoprotein [Neisseria animalis]VEE06557.1 Uncharacterized small protein [Neisseria animalis]
MKLPHKYSGRLKQWLQNARIAANYMAGFPDYDRYVAQQRKHNPDTPVMTKVQFLDYCQNKRGGGCC